MAKMRCFIIEHKQPVAYLLDAAEFYQPTDASHGTSTVTNSILPWGSIAEGMDAE
jgi:hypothetical protein